MISETLAENNPLLMAFVESHLSIDILDTEIHIKNYSIFRSDRNERSHGGVINYIREDIAATTKELLAYSNDMCEVLCLELKEANTIVMTVYRPPNCFQSRFQDVMEKINEIMEPYRHSSLEKVILGDFNFPGINWNNDTICGNDKLQAQLLLDFMDNHNFMQHIKEPTRKNNILDLVMTQNQTLVHNYEILKTALSDHNLIFIDTYINAEKENDGRDKKTSRFQKNNFSNLNFHSKKTDWEELKFKLQAVRWADEMTPKNLDEMTKFLIEKCLEFSKEETPKRQTKKPKSIPRDRNILMKQRKKIINQISKASRTEFKADLQDKIVEIEKKLLLSFSNEEINEENKAIAIIKSNSKYFFSYAKKKQKTKAKIGPIVRDSGDLITEDAGIAKALKLQYEKAFSSPISDKVIQDPNTFFEGVNGLSDFEFTAKDVEEAIATIPTNSAAGPDEFPAILLKKCKEELSHPIYIIWKRSLDSGVIPDILKNGIVTPIHKGGSRGIPANYRPVVLTSFLIKIFEKIVKAKIFEYLHQNTIIKSKQHAYLLGKSCLSNLINHYEQILDILEEGKNADVVYLDFAKAFDKVDHGLLLHKLKLCGIGGKVGIWIHSFLDNRHQQVAVNGTLSERSRIISGVPQGSVLGPLLFLIFINDIFAVTRKSSSSSFADDTKAIYAVKTIEDTKVFQSDLNLIYDWAATNNMSFNESKFVALRYGNDKEIKEQTCYITGDGKTEITETKQTRDLGIIMSDSAKFTDHINKVAKEAKRLSGWILRTFKSRDITCMLTLYKSLILPKMEYCCQLWNPASIGEIETLESIQRSFTSKILSINNKNYWERLESLKMYSLQRRRERYCIIYIWKMLEGIVQNDIIFVQAAATRGRTVYIKGPISNIQSIRTLRMDSFCRKGPKMFNSLPAYLRDMTLCSVEVFKKALDNFLLKIEDKPPINSYPSTWPHYNKLENLLKTNNVVPSQR